MEQNEMARTTKGIAAFVESKTKFRVGLIKRPPPISKREFWVGTVHPLPYSLKN